MANPYPKKKKIGLDGKSRINLRIPPDLDAWITAYAKRNNTTMTELIIRHFLEIKQKEEGDRVPQV